MYGNTSAQTREFLNFGGADSPISLIDNSQECYGIEIGPDSEIDRCWLIIPNEQVQGGLANGAAAYYQGQQPAGSNGLPVSFMLTPDHPYNGHIKGPIQIFPVHRYSLGWNGAVGTFLSGITAKLTLRVYRTPVNLVAAKRAPLKAVWWSPIAAGNQVIIPTFGRKLLRLFAADQAGGNLIVDYIWCSAGGSSFNIAGFTANPIVVPAGPSATTLKSSGASFETTDLPDWIRISDDGANIISFMMVEVYD